MLVSFSAKNYRSFRREATLHMTPAPRQREKKESVLHQKIGNTDHRVLCSAVLYGANGSGKSNFIGAIHTLQNIIWKGNIEDDLSGRPITNEAQMLQLIPYGRAAEDGTEDPDEPIVFRIEFIEREMLIEYELSIYVGKFLEFDKERYIAGERLSVNGRPVFERKRNNGKDSVTVRSLKPLQGIELSKSFVANPDLTSFFAADGLDDKKLFLTNGFGMLYSKEFTELFQYWFTKKLWVIYRGEHLMPRRPVNPGQGILIEAESNDILEQIVHGHNKVGFVKDSQSDVSVLYSLFGQNRMLPAELYESQGTMQLLSFLPALIQSIHNGGVLILDGMEGLLHPNIMLNIINLYHTPGKKYNHLQSQLIFDTHNPIYLTNNNFRRDEIYFVERTPAVGSRMKSLASFGTVGAQGVRKTEDYLGQYMKGKYVNMPKIRMEKTVWMKPTEEK